MKAKGRTGYAVPRPKTDTISPARANRIVLKPHITERTFDLIERDARICFIAARNATKPQISQAVSILYKMEAVDVNTARTISGKKAFVKFESVEKARDLATKIGML